MVGFDSAIQARIEALLRRSDCPNQRAEWNWLEVNKLFPKRRMHITMDIRMNSIRVDTPPAGVAGRALSLARNFGNLPPERR